MSGLVLGGIEGSNPLGFLAALGTLRLCDAMWPERPVRMRWVRSGGWRPELLGLPVDDDAALCRALQAEARWAPLEPFRGLGENLTVKPEVFSGVVRAQAATASPGDRRAADFAAAFGCEIFEDEKRGRIPFTDLCFITGSGHQDFLGTARGLERECQPEHLQEALFGPWRYADRSLSLRWDPEDAKEYALQWENPSTVGVTSVWGANRLAFEALPLLPAMPGDRGLRTTGFATLDRAHEFTWPIWTQAAGCGTVRSLLACRDLQVDPSDEEEQERARARLRAMGVEEAFRAQRIRIGQGANFKVSFRPARAV
jgi:hypothetical protein